MIGDSIKKLREKRGLTQEQIAADPDFGINANTLASYERNGREPRIDTIVKIAKYFGVSADYLIGLSDYETPENAIIARQIPLSNTAIDFLKGCTPEVIDVVDKILSAPNVGEFIEVFRAYAIASFEAPDEIPPSMPDAIVMAYKDRGEKEFTALVDRWKWDEVSRALEDLYREIRDEFDPNADAQKRGRPKKRGPYKKRTKEPADMSAKVEGGADDGNGQKEGQ